jgi:phage-related protein
MSLIWDIKIWEFKMAEWILVRFYGPVRDVIHDWPIDVRKELGSVLTRLQKGESIGMPDVRTMPEIYARVSEIRIADKSGSYRTLYVIKLEFGILVFHAFRKKNNRTLEKEKRTARVRLEEFLKELEAK